MDFISLPLLFSFMGTCLIIELTPGPNMGYLAIISITHGKKAGFSSIAGIALGLLAIGLASALGVATLIENSSIAYQTLKMAGVFYLLWLAWDGWRGDPSPSSNTHPHPQTGLKFFWRGFISNILNPKAALFYIAVLPEFFAPERSVIPQAISLTATYVSIATVIHILIVILASSARYFLENEQKQTRIRRILSVALALMALWFAWANA